MPSLQTASSNPSLDNRSLETPQHENSKPSQHLDGQSDPLAGLSMGGDVLVGLKDDSDPLVVFRKTRDEGDFKKFCDAAWHSYYRIARGIIGNHHSAEDVVQIAFLKIFKSIETVRDEKLGSGGINSWAKMIVAHTAVDYWRSEHRHNKRISASIEQVAEVRGSSPQPDEQLTTAEIVQRVHSVLGELPDIYGSVLMRSMYDRDARYETLAEHYGVPVGTIKSRLASAKKILVRRLKPFYDADL